MSSREHVLYLDARIYVPVGHAVLFHHGQLLFFQRSVLSDVFHYLKRSLVLYAFEHQIVHYVVSGGNHLSHGSHALSYIVLGVIEPYVCTVGKAGYSDKIGKLVGLGIIQHLSYKRSTEFRYSI